VEQAVEWRLGLAGFALPAFAGDRLNIVYLLPSEGEAGFVLGNVRNHISGAGGRRTSRPR